MQVRVACRGEVGRAPGRRRACSRFGRKGRWQWNTSRWMYELDEMKTFRTGERNINDEWKDGMEWNGIKWN